jgi:hypothetical protein
MLRSPSFQEELSKFLRRYPVFFCFRKKLLHSYGTVEKEATEVWHRFLQEYAAMLEKVEESDESTIYKYVLRNTPQSVELEQWEERVRGLEIQLWRAANELHGEIPEGPVLSRVSKWRGMSLLGMGIANPDYLSLAECRAEDFELADREFAERWRVFPHHVRSQEKEIVVLREDVPRLDSNIKLLIPVSDLTTKEELERRWSEVASIQSTFYAKKKRPHRAPFETLLTVC